MDLKYYNSYAEVDLDAIRDNVAKVQAHIGPKQGFIPVVKGNAYGMGTVPIARMLVEDCGIKVLADAQAFEAIQVREAGMKDVDILILGGAPEHVVPYAVQYRMILPLFTKESVLALSKAARDQGVSKVEAQIKIETGLNRIGARPGDQLAALLECIRECGNIEIVGCFTHFAHSTEYDNAFTEQQYKEFVKGVEQIKAAGWNNMRYIHCANTGATVWFEKAKEICTHVRNGSLYLGYSSMDDYSNPLNVKEPYSWRAFITNIHEIGPGESLGYNQYFKPEKPTKVATISVGYGDGFYRPMAMNFGPVLLNDTKTRYLGLCMDQTFVDATGIDCKLGDEVTIFGYSKGGALLSAFELERFTKQSFVYPICSPNQRVLRVYKGEKK